ncbi:MAG: hypothetical protein MRZ50_08625, partial [Prevotella sp.]|nr:hypothetical protein [Prevotella sp.]
KNNVIYPFSILSKNFTNISSKTRVFTIEIFFARKYAKKRQFWWFCCKVLIIRNLNHVYLKAAFFDSFSASLKLQKKPLKTLKVAIQPSSVATLSPLSGYLNCVQWLP